MTTTEQEPDPAVQEAEDQEPEARDDTSGLTGTIALIILAMLCGCAALIFVVFGGWPGAIFILAAVMFGVLAKKRSRRLDERTNE
jgi:hypothetical protein